MLPALGVWLFAAHPLVAGAAMKEVDWRAPRPLPTGHVLVVGFLGGWEPWNNDTRWARKLCLKIRARRAPGVHAESAGNKDRALVLRMIRESFPKPGDARLILYGQSFGGAAVVKLARELKALGMPVLLTVQVDSVGRDDESIPDNVRRAANFYQRDGWPVRGEPAIRADDVSRTEIAVNRRFDYRDKAVDLSGYSWIQRKTRAAHTKMDADPEVWGLVEELIWREIERVNR